MPISTKALRRLRALQRDLEPEVHLDLEAYPQDQLVELLGIAAKSPGKGHGTEALRRLRAWADATEASIVGNALPYSPDQVTKPPLNRSALMRWYERNGFKRDMRDEDYDLNGSFIYSPKKKVPLKAISPKKVK